MRPYHMSGNNNRSCGCSSISPSARCAEPAPCAESARGVDAARNMESIPRAGSSPCTGNTRPGSEYVLAMAYVPWQEFSSVYEPDRALSAGTIFPELDKPFLAAKGGRCR